MTIKRIEFLEGIYLDRGKNPIRQVEKVVEPYIKEAEVLAVGRYHVRVPNSLAEPVAINVTPEGRGYLLKYRGSLSTNQSRYYPFLRIPDDRDSIAILGKDISVDSEESKLKLYAYFFYTPGSSPSQE